MDIGFWTNPTSGDAGPKVNMMVTNKEAMLLNANWIIQRATTLQMFRGTNASAVTKIQKQVTSDVQASFGWNAGRYKVTKPNDKAAWWKGKTGEGVQSDPDIAHPEDTGVGTHRTQPIPNKASESLISQVLAQLNRIYPGDNGTKALVKALRKHHPDGRIPCVLNPSHAYNIYGWGPFRLRCKEFSCKHNLNLGNSYRWFANLIITGQVAGDKLGLDDFPGVPQVAPVTQLVKPRANTIPARPTPRELLITKKADLLRFKTTLQGPAPPPSHPPHRAITSHQVQMVTGSNPPAFHTSHTAKDGNCMFQAVAFGLGSSYTAAEVRSDVIRWMGANYEDFLPFMEYGEEGQAVAFREYRNRMSQSGQWGGEHEIKAICGRYKVRISILKRREDGSLFWRHHGQQDHPRCVWLYLSHHHYENLYPASQVTRVW